jgi:predicted GNAT family N-acyltransferase
VRCEAKWTLRDVQVAREAVREAQMTSGRVWTRTATLGHNYGAAIVQQAIDVMSDDELAAKVRQRLFIELGCRELTELNSGLSCHIVPNTLPQYCQVW